MNSSPESTALTLTMRMRPARINTTFGGGGDFVLGCWGERRWVIPGIERGARELWRFHLGTGFIERFRVDPDGPRGPQRSPAVPSDPERSRAISACTAGGNSGECSAMSHTFASHVLSATPWHDRIPGTPTGQPTQPTCSHIPCAFTLTCAHCHHGAGVCASPATRRTPELKLHCVR